MGIFRYLKKSLFTKPEFKGPDDVDLQKLVEEYTPEPEAVDLTATNLSELDWTAVAPGTTVSLTSVGNLSLVTSTDFNVTASDDINFNIADRFSVNTTSGPSFNIYAPDGNTAMIQTGNSARYVGSGSHGVYIDGFTGTAALRNTADTASVIVKMNGDDITLKTVVLLIDTLPTFADEAAAAALTTNQLYKTATGEVRIKL